MNGSLKTVKSNIVTLGDHLGWKGVVSSYQNRLVLPLVAEIHAKMCPNWINLQFSIGV